MNILISAYGCGPGRGSEPGVGWNWSKELAQTHSVWVLTPESERAAIENNKEVDRSTPLHFVHCDIPRWCRPSNHNTRVRYHLHYHLWQIYALWVARRLHKDIGFDVTHHLVLGAHWKPSFLAFLPIPFLWGPLGGGESVPPGFAKDLPLRGRLTEALRIFVRWVAERDPFLRFTARRSRLTLTKTRDTAARVTKLGSPQVQVFSEAALPLAEFQRFGTLPVRTGGVFRFISIGRLIYWKGFSLGLRAFAKVVSNHPDCELWIVGDGAERRSLEQLAEQLGVLSQVRFVGELPRASVAQMIGECDALVHPSLHDSGGWVCLEAMSARRPVVCLNLGGPAVQVTEATGFKIAAHSPEKSIQDLAAAMSRLAGDRTLATTMGQAGREHVLRHYTWKEKSKAFLPMYEHLATYSKQNAR